jgi:hypothetical protein
MHEGERKTWLGAAFMALYGLRLDEIIAAIPAVMRKVDHPSKIVPAIVAEIESPLNKMIRQAGRPPQLPAPTPVETAAEKAEREEVGLLMKGLVRKLSGGIDLSDLD